MPDTDPSATLAGIREHHREAHYAIAMDGPNPLGSAMASVADIPVLVAMAEAVLKHHRKSMFPAGPPGAGDAYGKHYCAGICYASIDDQVIYRVWPCQPYRDITAALAGKEAGDGR